MQTDSASRPSRSRSTIFEVAPRSPSSDSTLTTSRGEQVRLSDLITLETRQVVASINRHNQRYAMQINWEYIGTDRMRQAFINEIIDGLQLPYGYTAEDVSGARMSEDEEEEMRTVLWITLLFIFMTLAALFESVTLPVLVLLSVPFVLGFAGPILLLLVVYYELRKRARGDQAS